MKRKLGLLEFHTSSVLIGIPCTLLKPISSVHGSACLTEESMLACQAPAKPAAKQDEESDEESEEESDEEESDEDDEEEEV